MTGREELKEQLALLEEIVGSNPCSMPDSFFAGLSATLKGMIGKQYSTGLSKEQVALYFGMGIVGVLTTRQ